MASIKSTRVVVASTAELKDAVARYAAQGYQLKAMTDTTASLEKLESAYKVWKMAIGVLLCLIPGLIYAARNPPTKMAGEVVLIQVEG